MLISRELCHYRWVWLGIMSFLYLLGSFFYPYPYPYGISFSMEESRIIIWCFNRTNCSATKRNKYKTYSWLILAADIMLLLFPLRVPTQLLLIPVSNPHHTHVYTHTYTHTHTHTAALLHRLSQQIIKADESITQSHISQRLPSKILKYSRRRDRTKWQTSFSQNQARCKKPN